MITKMFIVLSLLGVLQVHMVFQPKESSGFDEMTDIVIKEYESSCIRKTIKLSGEGYTCKDLKRYLHKKGYE